MILKLIGLFLVLFVFSFGQLRTLWKRKRKKPAIVYSCLLGLCAVIGICLLTGVHIPSPAVPLRAAFEPVGNLLFP